MPAVENEINEIIGVLKNFSADDSNISIDTIELSIHDSHLSIIANDGKRYAFRNLPAGYKRLFYMVLDIAYRSYILSDRQTTNISGLVIIDEIDLHLHPQLEQVVLQRLTKTFPSVQFIVSTHSPLVLTGIKTETKTNCVLKMVPDSDEPERLENIHGIDYNLMLEDNMNVSKRDPDIQDDFDKAWQQVAEKNIEGAKATLKQLEENTPGNQVELIKLRAMISRIEMIGR